MPREFFRSLLVFSGRVRPFDGGCDDIPLNGHLLAARETTEKGTSPDDAIASQKSALGNRRRVDGSPEQDDGWICGRRDQALHLYVRLGVTPFHFFGQDGIPATWSPMYLEVVAAAEIGEVPWVPLTMQRGLAVELDDKTCQARQGQGVVARIDRGHIRLQFRLSFKRHFRRVHNAADQRTVHLQMGANQDVVEGSILEGGASDRPHM